MTTTTETFTDGLDTVLLQLNRDERTSPILNPDLLLLLDRNQNDERLKTYVLPNFPEGVLEQILRCRDCNKPLTKNGRAFAPLDAINGKVAEPWFYRAGGYNVLGWTEDNCAKYIHDEEGRFKTASFPLEELCCTDCGEIPECKLSPDKVLLSTICLARREGSLVETRGILPDDFPEDTLSIEVPNYAFRPDQWSKAFLQGLSKVDVQNKSCLEVGVGTGINVIYLLTKSPHAIAISDKEGRCVPLACRNIRRHFGESKDVEKVLPYSRSLELASWLESAVHDHFDIVYACLPQVILPQGEDINRDDALAHYYEKERYPSDLGIYGLALNDIFLQQARPHLNPGGSVVLNLGGRPGQKTLEELFIRNGFKPTLLHHEVIAQHAETSLRSLSTLEVATGREFEFFADANAQEPLNASRAEARRESGLPVFHRIYVYQGHIS